MRDTDDRPVAVKPPNIPNRISELGGALDTLEGTFAELAERLSPITAPDYPKDGPGEPDAVPEQSELAGRIMHCTATVYALQRRVAALNERIEL